MQGSRRFGRLLALLAFILPLALIASPAGAVQPQREVIHQSGEFLLADCGGGVVLTDTFTEVDTIIVFFDANGNPVRVQFHANFTGVITNSGSGNTYRDAAHFMEEGDLVDGTRTVHGMNYANTIQGAGIVVHQTRTIIFDSNRNILFEAGPHEVTEGTADFCSVFV
jgi:hypothetical protein